MCKNLKVQEIYNNKIIFKLNEFYYYFKLSEIMLEVKCVSEKLI